ncbi:nuclear transport factor 2 family protein [Bacillus timonensis]|nr:nuclear transport factor 2 family protein [Bacillus timonensis]
MKIAEELAQKQLDAYNQQNIEAFISVYSEDVVVMEFPSNKVMFSGMNEFRNRYEQLFQNNPNQYAALKNRIVKGNVCIDHEWVTGRANGEDTEAVAMYEVEDGLISKVWFIK